MSLDEEYDRIRDVINGCAGYRVLEDSDILERGDETACASTLLSAVDTWQAMGGEFKEFFGRTVADMNDRKHNDEMDTEERMFRRKVKR